MDVVLEISLILMGMIVGYLIGTWPRINLGNRKEELLNKKNLDWQDKLRGIRKDEIMENDWGINFHSTSTQGPPRRSAMATLEGLLEIALKNENYEYAAQLRDKLIQIQYNKNK